MTHLTDDANRRLGWLHAHGWITGWAVVDDPDPELHLFGFDGCDGTMALTPAEADTWLSGYVAGVQRAS